MNEIFEHQELVVPPTLEELTSLLIQKYSEGWRLNSLQLVRIAADQTQQDEPDGDQ